VGEKESRSRLRGDHFEISHGLFQPVTKQQDPLHPDPRVRDPHRYFPPLNLASLAKQEVVRHSERVRAGMARARAQGKPISRSPIPNTTQHAIIELHRCHTPKREIARRLSLDPKTVRNYIISYEAESS
jgi:hypothetical protein